MPSSFIPPMLEWVIGRKAGPPPERVTAAYYRASAGLFEFKDDQNKVVFSIAQDAVLDIRRVAPCDETPREVDR